MELIMKKLLSAVLCVVMLAGVLAVSAAAVSGENGKTGWEKKPADVSEGWTRYQLEEQDVYLKGVLAAADNTARKHSQNHYSNGLAVNFGTDASNIPIYTAFSEMTLDDNASRIEVKVTSEYAGASQITLYTRQTYNGSEELPLRVGVKVNDGAVIEVRLTPAPVEGAGDYGKRICYTTVDIELKAGENVIRISPPYQTATTQNYWVTFDAMDVKIVEAPVTPPARGDDSNDDTTGENPDTGAELLSVVLMSVLTVGTAVVLSKKSTRR